jgi:ribosomal protein S7
MLSYRLKHNDELEKIVNTIMTDTGRLGIAATEEAVRSMLKEVDATIDGLILSMLGTYMVRRAIDTEETNLSIAASIVGGSAAKLSIELFDIMEKEEVLEEAIKNGVPEEVIENIRKGGEMCQQ